MKHGMLSDAVARKTLTRYSVRVTKRSCYEGLYAESGMPQRLSRLTAQMLGSTERRMIVYQEKGKRTERLSAKSFDECPIDHQIETRDVAMK